MASLPMELMTAILSRLPVKSLCRFKCVSKSWNLLICSPNLMKLHLAHLLSSDNRLLILNYGSHLESMPYKLGSDFDATTSRFDLPTSFSSGYEISVSGSCNGLISLVCTNVDDPSLFEVILWNPSTNTHFILPHDEPPSELTDFMCASFGFGFCNLKDDYRIVKIVEYFVPKDEDNGSDSNHGDVTDDDDGGGIDDGDGDVTDDDDGGGIDDGDGDFTDDDGDRNDDGENDSDFCDFGFVIRIVKVYSLIENCWKMNQVQFSGNKMACLCPGAVIGNHIVHWILWDYLESKPLLSGFDLSSLKWVDILALPDLTGKKEMGCPSDDDGSLSDHGFDQSDIVGLGILDECLCLVTKICPKFDNNYVWVMKEYGIPESWTKLFKVTEADIVGPLLGAPLACSRGGDEVLLRRENEDGLCCYSLSSRMIKAAPEIPNNLKIHDVSLCVESLLSAHGSEDDSKDQVNV